jgi:IS30 family transposase
MEKRKRLNKEQKHEIYSLYQQDLVSREIGKKIGCSAVTVCHWIHRLIETDAGKKRRVPLRIKPHRPHRPQQCRGKKLTLKEKEDLMVKIVELYQKYESAPKVADELKKEGIRLSPPTILKRVRKSNIFMNPPLFVPVTVEMKI